MTSLLVPVATQGAEPCAWGTWSLSMEQLAPISVWQYNAIWTYCTSMVNLWTINVTCWRFVRTWQWCILHLVDDRVWPTNHFIQVDTVTGITSSELQFVTGITSSKLQFVTGITSSELQFVTVTISSKLQYMVLHMPWFSFQWISVTHFQYLKNIEQLSWYLTSFHLDGLTQTHSIAPAVSMGTILGR